MHPPLRLQPDQHRPGHGNGKEDPVHRSEDETDPEEVLRNRRVQDHVERAEENAHRQALRQAPDHRGPPGQRRHGEEVSPEKGRRPQDYPGQPLGRGGRFRSRRG